MHYLKVAGDYLKIAVGVALAGYIVFAAGAFPGSMRAYYDMKYLFNQSMDLVDYHQAKKRYYFDGLLERGLIDVCQSKHTGEVDVYFKEDCVADLK